MIKPLTLRRGGRRLNREKHVMNPQRSQARRRENQELMWLSLVLSATHSLTVQVLLSQFFCEASRLMPR